MIMWYQEQESSFLMFYSTTSFNSFSVSVMTLLCTAEARVRVRPRSADGSFSLCLRRLHGQSARRSHVCVAHGQTGKIRVHCRRNSSTLLR